MKLFMRLFIESSNCNFKKAFLLPVRLYHGSVGEIKPQFSEQSVHIKCCGSVYKNWQLKKKFKTIPNTDLTFRVPYIDTHNGLANQSRLPLVVTLHGAPGSWRDFTLMTSYLYQQGIRVVIPSFPDFRTYRPGIFRHSDEEKAEYIYDFLKAIDVTQVNTLICHSSAIYPSLLLCLQKKGLNVKSLAMLNPGTFSPEKMRSTKHLRELKCLVNASENLVMFKLMEYLGPFVLKFVKLPVRADHCLDPLLSVTVMCNANIRKAKEKFQQLSTQNFPILYAFSKNDVLIGSESSYDLAHLLGARDTDIYMFDSKGELKSEGKKSPALKVLCFENGSHYVFWKHSEVIHNELKDFILENCS